MQVGAQQARSGARRHASALAHPAVGIRKHEVRAGHRPGVGRCRAAVGAFAPLSVKDVARQANLDKSPASRAVQALVDEGLVAKQASEVDGRGVVLTLTPKGRRVWQRVMALIERRNEQILACLSAAERRELDRLLERVLEHARGGEADGGAAPG
jgi:DNA-binding MarR family transcriptional regulator